MRRRYDEDRWLAQPFYPILIVEKDTMEPVRKPMAYRGQMPFASSRGYGSLTLQHDVAEMLNRRRALTGQSRVVFRLIASTKLRTAARSLRRRSATCSSNERRSGIRSFMA
jgi:hypothetical protein